MVDLLQKPLQCVIVTPEKSVLDASAEFVVLPMYDGELGVLPGRAPLIGRLGYGELRLRNGQNIERYFIEFLRGDPGRGEVFGGVMTGTQLISICLVLGGGLIWWLKSGVPKTVVAPQSSS